MALKIITDSACDLPKKDLLEIYPDFRLTIVDSKCASIGFGLVVRMAAQMQRNGRSRQEIVESDVGCAIGAHTGQGIIGITFLDELSPYL